eukprot:6152482-Prymnesium_polylepis.1
MHIALILDDLCHPPTTVAARATAACRRSGSLLRCPRGGPGRPPPPIRQRARLDASQRRRGRGPQRWQTRPGRPAHGTGGHRRRGAADDRPGGRASLRALRAARDHCAAHQVGPAQAEVRRRGERYDELADRDGDDRLDGAVDADDRGVHLSQQPTSPALSGVEARRLTAGGGEARAAAGHSSGDTHVLVAPCVAKVSDDRAEEDPVADGEGRVRRDRPRVARAVGAEQ